MILTVPDATVLLCSLDTTWWHTIVVESTEVISMHCNPIFLFQDFACYPHVMSNDCAALQPLQKKVTGAPHPPCSLVVFSGAGTADSRWKLSLRPWGVLHQQWTAEQLRSWLRCWWLLVTFRGYRWWLVTASAYTCWDCCWIDYGYTIHILTYHNMYQNKT